MSAPKIGFIHAAKKSVYVFLSLLVLTLSFSQMVSAAGPEGLNVSGHALYFASGAPVLVAPDLTLTGSDIDNVRVSISTNFTPGDYLGMQGVSGTSGALSGLNWSYNPATGVLDLQNAATTAVYQNVLRRITFYRISGVYSSTTRTIDFSIISSLYCAATGHYYEYVNSFKNWEAAKTEAAGRTYFGLQGYLATVTSQAENSFILGKMQGWGWIGATDNLTKPEWYWVTGPEGAANGGIGTNFFTQKRATFNSPDRVTVFGGNIGSGGDAIPGFYNNWSPDQPDDSGPTGEYFAHIYKNDGFHTDGTWNDYIGAIQGYVVEYGGMAGDPALQLTGNVTVNILYPQAVGGEVAQVNKPALLVPALVIGAVLMLGGTILVLSRRKRG